MIFQKKLFLTWRTEREINFLKYSWSESFFFWIKKNVGWSERRCTVSLHELLVWFRHIGKEKERWLSEAQTTQHCQSIFILLLPRKNSFRFVYTVWLAKMCKTQKVCWKAGIELKFLRLLNLQSPFIERLNNLSCPESYIPFTMRQFKIRITYRLKTALYVLKLWLLI